MRERESIFQDYVSDLRRKEKEDKASQKEKVSVKYFGKGITRKCQWINVLGMTDLVLKRKQVTISYQSASSIFGNSVYHRYLKPVSLFLRTSHSFVVIINCMNRRYFGHENSK